METMEEVRAWLNRFFHDLYEVLAHKGNRKNAYVVEQIMEYVKRNYQQEITLKNLSQVIYLTPNYLSNIFSQQTGENFMDYLTRYRIEKAKELLLKHKYRVYEVGEMVGYRNTDYFRKIFKDIVGESPLEYVK